MHVLSLHWHNIPHLGIKQLIRQEGNMRYKHSFIISSHSFIQTHSQVRLLSH
ncbi:hypothetical protein HBA_0553 [Sodalis endosymbiont of Henestaris halophilus]|nr:hypothetical protein HBA_0553 [Sodalis endosymbiont of Henestaris halophilus]